MGRPPKNPDAPYWRQMRRAECSLIQSALEAVGSVSRASKALGVSTTFLANRMKELDITKPESDAEPKTKEEREAEYCEEAARAAEAKLQEYKEKQKEAHARKQPNKKPADVIPINNPSDRST